MKKIFLSLVAVAAIAACTKSEVQYTEQAEMSFAPVTRLNTKVSVDGTDYPDALNMFVFANAGEATADLPAGYTDRYFANAEFTHSPVRTPALTLNDHVFAGVTPYYWPNVKRLIFSGYSASGNVRSINPLYKWNTYVQDGESVKKLADDESVGSQTIARQAWEIEMKGYTPGQSDKTNGVAGDNDLMWFPTTDSYGKPATTGSPVEVTMKHACAWVTINIKGDATTGKSGTTWNIKTLSFTDLSQSGDVTLGAEADWTSITAGTDFYVFNSTMRPLTTEYVDYTNIDFKDLVIVPQETKTLYVKYEYVSQEGLDPIEETKPIVLAYSGNQPWKAGKHYTYNITLGTEEILIQPILTDWTEETQVYL